MPKLVCNGAMLGCTFGQAPSSFVVTSTHKVMAHGQTAATVMDHLGMSNIMPFGLCTSPSNPAVIAAQGAPQPCQPVVPSPWTTGSMTIKLGGQNALNDTSQAMCMWAGVITVRDAGQPKVKTD